jgi:AcrR family transcriptional regulator
VRHPRANHGFFPREGPTERKDPRRNADRISRRSRKRAHDIAEAVRELAARGPVSLEQVAAYTGVPLGYLEWAYPTIESLLAAPNDAR